MLQSSGAASALGYVFGAFGAEAVPGPSLIDLLQDLGVAESAARTMMSRLTRDGQLTVQRHGRVAVYRLAGSFRDRFFRLRHADEPLAWPGAFQMIMYDIAEQSRRDRDALRERAAAAGFSAARPGMLIGFGDPADWVAEWAERDDLFVRTGQLHCTVEVAVELAERAWNLADSAPPLHRYLQQLERIRRRDASRPAAAPDAFRLLNDVMRGYGELYVSTPSLPIEITPADWPGQYVPAALGAISGLLGPRAQQHAMDSVDRRELRHLLELLDA